MDKSKPSLLKIDIRINNFTFEALVNSGASSSYISKAAASKRLPFLLDKSFSKMKHSLSIASQSIINNFGKVNIEAEDVEKQFKANLTIIDNLEFDIILGMAFLKNNRVIFDAEENMIYYKPIVKNEVFTNFTTEILLLQELSLRFTQKKS